MKVSMQAPDGFDPATAPHRLIVEAENDEEISVLVEVAAQLLKDPKKTPILLPRGTLVRQ